MILLNVAGTMQQHRFGDNASLFLLHPEELNIHKVALPELKWETSFTVTYEAASWGGVNETPTRISHEKKNFSQFIKTQKIFNSLRFFFFAENYSSSGSESLNWIIMSDIHCNTLHFILAPIFKTNSKSRNFCLSRISQLFTLNFMIFNLVWASRFAWA